MKPCKNPLYVYPDSKTHGTNMGPTKIHGANMGPTWVLSAPGGPHVGLMNLAIWVTVLLCSDMDMLFHIIVPLWGNPLVILVPWVPPPPPTHTHTHTHTHKEPVLLSLWMKTWGTKWSVLTRTLKQMSPGVFLTCKKGKQNYQHVNIQHGNQHGNIQSV